MEIRLRLLRRFSATLGKSGWASEPRHLQVGRLWEFGRRRDAQVCEGRSRAAEHQPLRNLRASRTFERVALKCDLQRWIAPLLHLHETHLSAAVVVLSRGARCACGTRGRDCDE